MYTVFIADDESKVINGLINHINWNALNASVIGYAKNGNEAESKILELQPNIIITDIFMPGQTGLTLMEHLKEKCNAVFIIFSAYSEFEYAREAFQLSAVDYLVKPVNIEDIEKTIRKAIGKYRSKKYSVHTDETEYQLWQLFEGNTSLPSDTPLHQYKSFFTIRIKFPSSSMKLDEIISQINDWSVMEGHLFLLKNHQELILIIAQTDILLASNARHKILSRLKTLQENTESIFYWGLGCIVENPEELSISFLSAKEMEEYCAFILHQIDGNPQSSFSSSEMNEEKENLLLFVESDAEAEQILFSIKEKIYFQNSSVTLIKAQTIDFAYRIRHQFEVTYENILPAVSDWNTAIISQLLEANHLEDMFKILHSLVIRLRNYADAHKDNFTQRYISRIRQYIAEHLMDNLNLNDIADLVNKNPSYVSFLFRQETGQTLFDYITQERMQRAKWLLRNTDKKVSDIARETGYEDQSYFSQIFRKYTGVTAGNYRKGEN